MGTLQILAAIFLMTGVVFLVVGRGRQQLLRILGIVTIVQGLLILAFALLRGA